MRRINIRHFLTGTLLLLLSVCMALAAWAEAPITFTDKNLIVVTFTFSKNSYALGSEIAVKYSISGGSGKYTFMDYHCYGDDNGSSLYYRGDSTSNVSPSGTIYFTPTVGQKAYVTINGVDSQGRHFDAKSKTVTLTGGETSTPIAVTITFTKSSYAVGNDVSARYQVAGGSGDYSILQYQCHVIDRGTTAVIKEEDVSSTSGSINFTPLFGQSAYISFWVYDSQGRSFSIESKRVSLTGASSGSAITGSVTLSKKSYKPGSLVTAKYSISGGSGSYTIWYKCWGLEEDGAYVIYKENLDDLTSPSGTITFTPKIGQYVCVDVFGYDSDDRHFSFSSKVVPLASLKKIGIKKITAVSKKKLKVEWKKLSAKDRKKIQYIQVQVSTSKNFTKIVKQKKVKSSKTSCTISGLKKNTKYYVRIRAYTKSGKNVSISAWTVKSKKTKKK